MRAALRIAACIFAALLPVALVVVWGAWAYLGPGPSTEEKIVLIPKGEGVDGIAAQLEESGALESPFLFAAAARLSGAGPKLKAGEYAIPARTSMRDILDMLREGRVLVHHLTIPEGYTSSQIVALLNADPSLMGTIEETPAEGALLPETYHFTHGYDRSVLLTRMRVSMDLLLQQLWAGRAEGLPFTTVAEAVTLASIVEKETAVDSERPRIAGVFINRLRAGMRLQSDPTVIFALTKGEQELDRSLTRSDLRTESPFNTYFTDGLPPGPIANPGRASLEAVMNPEQNDFYYFVADGTGGHAFAQTLEEHNQNVANWRKIEKERAASTQAAP